ncbi:hypothetical protein FB559_2121 [Actinoallomurus bryophytorum]|uniref:Uncharacterized protein n=2 Tax=Actinoallomurus bryophytorum TaxID=1490222 RepID=A0A543CHK2_9ACTN|nr:hypothetical protein FB559_2121 [Actinoallomurus bryophytorum]
MMTEMDEFNGEFTHITAREIRHRDVILGGARAVTAPPETAITTGTVIVTTGVGTDTYAPDAPVYVFRPASACANEPCPECGTEPGEPCDWACLSYAALDDAAGTSPA